MPYSTPDMRNLIETAPQKGERVYSVSVLNTETGKEDILWVKKAVRAKGTKWHLLQTLVAKFVPVPILRSTVSQGGEKALEEEKKRLLLFKEQNVLVPEVILLQDRVLITKSLGESLLKKLSFLEEQDRLILIEKAARALAQLHKKNLCHGRPHIKDLVVADDTANSAIGFLDFEENPLAVMTLPQAQARDIWLFVLSSAKFLSSGNLQKIISLLLDESEEEVQKECRKMTRFLRPLRKLLGFLKIKGSDVEKAIKANHAFEIHFSLS